MKFFFPFKVKIVIINRLSKQNFNSPFYPAPDCIVIVVVSGVLNGNIITGIVIFPDGLFNHEHTAPAITGHHNHFAFLFHFPSSIMRNRASFSRPFTGGWWAGTSR